MNFIKNESIQKLRGGYYTPLDLAIFITRWVLCNEPRQLLEPSCGDGVFFRALRELEPAPLEITGFEILEGEASKAREQCNLVPGLTASIHAVDFLGWAIKNIVSCHRPFDGIVGNPPFIRYQYLTRAAQQQAETIFDLLHLPFTKHTNAWVPFVLGSIALLKQGGRLAMILPAEIIHVAHAQSLRTYLGSTCKRLLVVDPEELWFDGTLQGAVILFAEKKETPSDYSEGLSIAKVRGRGFLNGNAEDMFKGCARMNGKTVEGKWTRALLSSNERDLLDDIETRPGVHRFGNIAKVDVGLVTGANKFFLVTDQIVQNFGLQEFAYPMFGRSEHCPGIIYDRTQHLANQRQGNPTNFIWITRPKADLSASVRRYLRLGEAQQLHTRYKCSMRNPWYTVPSVYTTRIGMLKRSHDTPRLIYNRLGAYTTDTAYRINSKVATPEKFVYCFMNALTALSADLEGRHYGGGVIELVPSEIERLIIALPPLRRPQIRRLDRLIRDHDVETVLQVQSKTVLGPLGVSMSAQEQLLSAWIRLKNRRQRTTIDA